jgi:UDP-glucose 4-epimerase
MERRSDVNDSMVHTNLSQTILLTGGLGYLGGRIADHLRAVRPATEIVLADVTPPDEPPAWTASFALREMDVTQPRSVRDCLAAVRPWAVVHLAAVNEIESQANPALAEEVNTTGARHVLEAARESGVRRVIYFSTFHVYGPAAPREITERTPTHPTHPYATTHRAAEDIVRRFNGGGMETMTFRLSNGYGWPMTTDVRRWTLVGNNFARQAVETGKIILRSSGRQHRDFVALGDVARAVDHFLRLPRWTRDVVHLGGACSMSVLDFARRVARVYAETFGLPVPQVIAPDSPEPQGDEGPIRYDIGRLLESGFSLAADMDAEIRKTLELCRNTPP